MIVFTVLSWMLLIVLVAGIIAGPISLLSQLRMTDAQKANKERQKVRWAAYTAGLPVLRRWKLRYWDSMWWWVKGVVFALVFIWVIAGASSAFYL